MNELLTIIIVTADRPTELRLCIDRLKVLPQIDKVIVDVWDNSKYSSNRSRNECIFKVTKDNFKYHYDPDFMECRNRSVSECKTEYFTILDDDDYLSVDAIPIMLYYIDEYPECEFFSYCVHKEGRFDIFNGLEYRFDNNDSKLFYLNDFDKYQLNRFNKVYLWNCANVISKKLAVRCNAIWIYKGCDDIYPITNMYLAARDIMKICRGIYYYSSQTTIGSTKSLNDLMELESNMIKSYAKLKYTFDPDNTNSIISKAIHNSIRQLEVIDNYNPVHLKELLNEYTKS